MSEFDASDTTWEPAELANVKGAVVEVPMEVHVEDGILWATSGIVNIELPGTEEA